MRIQLHKHPRTPHYHWDTKLLFEDDKGVICHNLPPRKLVHQTKGEIFIFDSDALEFYWRDLPFSLYCSRRPECDGLHYYSNIHSIPEITSTSIEMIDYDIDIVKEGRAPAKIVDQEEFEKHARELGYSEAIQTTVPEIALFVQSLLDRHEVFSKPAILALFEAVENRQGSFDLWTQDATILQAPTFR